MEVFEFFYDLFAKFCAILVAFGIFVITPILLIIIALWAVGIM